MDGLGIGLRITRENLTNARFISSEKVSTEYNGGISTNYGASNFGAVTSAHDPRTIQLALKFSF